MRWENFTVFSWTKRNPHSYLINWKSPEIIIVTNIALLLSSCYMYLQDFSHLHLSSSEYFILKERPAAEYELKPQIVKIRQNKLRQFAIRTVRILEMHSSVVMGASKHPEAIKNRIETHDLNQRIQKKKRRNTLIFSINNTTQNARPFAATNSSDLWELYGVNGSSCLETNA